MIQFAHYGEDRDLNLNANEVILVNRIMTLLSEDIDVSSFKLVRKSDAYATIVIDGSKYDKNYDSDFIRFKYSDKAKWVSFVVPYEDRDKYKDDPLFAADKNKKGIFWKSALDDSMTVDVYKDLWVKTFQEEISRSF
jgi:hypothetical protein